MSCLLVYDGDTHLKLNNIYVPLVLANQTYSESSQLQARSHPLAVKPAAICEIVYNVYNELPLTPPPCCAPPLPHTCVMYNG